MKNIFLSIIILLRISVVCTAQTVNTGEITVSPGTIFSTVSEFNNTSTGSLINHGEVYVYSHWNNDGMVDFLDNNGITRFMGNLPQLISGNNLSYFYDAQFNNGATQPAFQLSGDISITNESSFDLGIVDNDNFGGTFVFEQNGEHNLTRDASHVDGSVQKRGDNFFRYPIGDSEYYRFAEISAPEEVLHEFTGKYYYEDSNTNYPVANTSGNITIVDIAEHWTIERTTGDSEVLVTLSWSDVTTPSDILVAPYEAIIIARWDEALQLWVDEGGVVNVDEQTVTTAVDDYGVFTLARVGGVVLPCALTIYNVLTPNGDGLNDYFEVKQAISDTSCAQNLKVSIFNRWGVKVYEGDNYDTNSNLFGGYSDGRLTVSKKDKLPTGTYFYILTFDYENAVGTEQFKKAGYLYINGDK